MGLLPPPLFPGRVPEMGAASVNEVALREPSLGRRASTFFFGHPLLKLVLLLAPGLLWLVVLYLGSLGALLVQSFYHLEEFTGLVVKEVGLQTYKTLFDAANVDIIVRTTAMAAAVTVACAVIAFPQFARYDDVDTGVATLRLSGGSFGILSVTRHDPLGYDIRMELLGSGDSIAVGWDERMPLRSVEPGAPPAPADAYRGFQERFAEAYRAEMNAFVQVAAGRQESACTAEDALEADAEPSWPFLYQFSYRKFQGYVGACHARLGLRKAAVPALREAVEGMGPTKQKAILLTDLAIVVGGDEATELRREARQIGEAHQSRRVLARV